MPTRDLWDVAVVGGGPAGLAAARAAAVAGARTVVLERARHPRYKTCGGGLLGTSYRAVEPHLDVPVRDRVHAVTFTLDGRRRIRRESAQPLLAMVVREEFDAALAKAAADAGVEVSERSQVRAVHEANDRVVLRRADGGEVAARVVVGADGSGSVTARYVGVRCDQVDLGLEVELPAGEVLRRRWAGLVAIDWGPIPGSYGWVFPKGDRLTVGVIASRGLGEQTRRYLRDFVDRLGLTGIEPVHDTGHLTRCREVGSPLRRGRVLVAGDAAGLLEPWTREGISFALRSGALAGTAAARAARVDTPGEVEDALDGYRIDVERTLGAEMAAGRRILRAFERHPAAFHGALATPPGWRVFARFCRGETSLVEPLSSSPVAATLAALTRF
ncbi:MAG TPA: geranylgeranyl reductase family protein [Micromonosporaceae bacterium]